MTLARPTGRRWLGLAALAGALAVLSLVQSAWWGLVRPTYAPYVPVDLRLLAPLVLVSGSAAASRWLPWPSAGLVPPAATLGLAVVARLPASTVLAASGLAGARTGLAVNPLGLAAGLASVLVGLHMGLEAARAHARDRLLVRGVPPDEAAAMAEEGRRVARSSLAAAGLVAGALVAGVSLARGLLRGQTLPLPEVAGFLLAAAVAVVAADWRGLGLGRGS